MKTIVKRIAVVMVAAGCLFTGMSDFVMEVKAEEILGEGQFIQPAENVSDAPEIKFNTLYYTADSGYVTNGYVALKPEKDCYVIRGDRYNGWTLYDSTLDRLPTNSDGIYYEKLKAGETYYVSVSGQFMLNNFYDETGGDSKEEAMLINTNQEYDGSLAVYGDTDYFKFVADVTGRAKVVIYNSMNQSSSFIEVTAQYYNSGISLLEDEIELIEPDSTGSFYINVKEGEAYCLKLRESSPFDGEGRYSLQVVTAQVESIEFSPSQVSMNVQEGYQLKPVILPENVVDDSVKYQSSNEKVATVSNEGMIYAKNAGIATIICTAKDGSGTESVCEIIVKNPIKEHTASINALTNMGQGTVRVNARRDRYATGYQIKYSESKSMKDAKSASVAGTSKNITNLKRGRKYYFQVRAYALNAEGNRIYSKYSPVKAIRVSK